MIWLFALFTLIVIAFILKPLLGDSKSQLEQVTKSLDIRLLQLKRDYQFQSKELKRRLDSGDLDEEEWQSLSEELKKETAQSIASTEKAATAGSSGTNIWQFVSVVVVVAIVSYTSYYYVGFQEQQSHQSNLINMIKNDSQAIDKLKNKMSTEYNQENLDNLYLALRSNVEIAPESVNAWRDLTYFNANFRRDDEAQKTVKVALSIHPDNLDLILLKAQVLTGSNDTNEIIQGHQLIKQILDKDPTHQGALLLSGDSSYRIGMFDAAIRTWEKLRSIMAGNAQMVTALDKRIADARAKLEGKPDAGHATSGHTAVSSDQTSASQDEAGKPGILINISVPNHLMERLDGNETLYVFARAVSGPQFPIAAIRTKLGEVMGPLKLDDSQSMQEQFKLSNYDEITLVARISFSGSPTAVAGDIEGSIASVKRPFPAEPVELILNQVVE